MKKFLYPIIVLVCIALVSVTFGLGSNTAALLTVNEMAGGNWYQLVWEIGIAKGNVIVFNLVSFFAFCFGAFFLLIMLVPSKGRKGLAFFTGLMLIAAGVFMFLAPKLTYSSMQTVTSSGSLIAMGVLTVCAGAFAFILALWEMCPESKK